jgi:hypothetical protein
VIERSLNEEVGDHTSSHLELEHLTSLHFVARDPAVAVAFKTLRIKCCRSKHVPSPTAAEATPLVSSVKHIRMHVSNQSLSLHSTSCVESKSSDPQLGINAPLSAVSSYRVSLFIRPYQLL